MRTLRRPIVAAVLGLVVLAAVSIFDNGVLLRMQRGANANFSQGAYAILAVLGAMAVAVGVLVIGWLAWSSRSRLVAVVYIVIGGFVTLVPILLFSVPINLPEWAGRALTTVILSTGGPLNAATVCGSAMLVAGIAVLLSRTRRFGRRGL
jgi:hypothetical protein